MTGGVFPGEKAHSLKMRLRENSARDECVHVCECVVRTRQKYSDCYCCRAVK